MAVSVIIPAYRAAAGLQAAVAAARTLPGVTEIVVVDDGSRDGTSDAARAAAADRVITLPRNLGKGGALREGVAAAAGDTVLFLDADLGASAAQAAPLLQAIGDGPAMSVAVFPARPARGGLGFAKGLAGTVVRLFTGLSVAAPLSGQRALPAEVARAIGMASRWGVEVGLTVEAFHLGVPIIEQPVPLEHHHTGRDVAGFRHRLAQFLDVLRYALGVGYGLSWPALTRKQVAVRVAVWLAGFASLFASSMIWAGAWTGHTIGVACSPGHAWYFLEIGYDLSGQSVLPILGLSLLAAALWLPSLWLSSVTLGSRKTNYLGRTLPGAAGLLIPLVTLITLALQPGFSWWNPPLVTCGFSWWNPPLLVACSFGAVGLLDDLYGHLGRARGLRGHLAALLKGRFTTGAIKAVGGLGAGCWAAFLVNHDEPNRLALMVLDGLVIALCANLLNLLDLRPGRALKGFLLLSLVAGAFVAVNFSTWQPSGGESLYFVQRMNHALPVLLPTLLAALVMAPSDLAGRVILGDVGANTLGAIAGLALVYALPVPGRLAALIILIAIHVYCERASLTDLIARHRALRWLDALGTCHLPPLPSPAGLETRNPKPEARP